MPSWRNLKGGLLTLALVLEAAHDAQHLCRARRRADETQEPTRLRASARRSVRWRQHKIISLQGWRAHLLVKANRRCAHSAAPHRSPPSRFAHSTTARSMTQPRREARTIVHTATLGAARACLHALLAGQAKLLRLPSLFKGVYILLDGGEWLLLMLWQTCDRLFHPFLLLGRSRSRLGLGGSVLQHVVRHEYPCPSKTLTSSNLLLDFDPVNYYSKKWYQTFSPEHPLMEGSVFITLFKCSKFQPKSCLCFCVLRNQRT
jgi:hypothetical protein